MKLIKKKPPDLSVSQRNPDHKHYWVLDENIKVPRQVLEYTIETNSSCYSLYPLLYQLAIKAKVIIELGIGPAKSSKSMLWGLKDGKQGCLYSIDWGNEQTQMGVDGINKLDVKKYFTWVKKDFFAMPDEWFKKHKADLIFVDFNAERKRPEEVYKSIYENEPYPDKKHPRSCQIMLEKLLLTMKKESLLVLKPYFCEPVIYRMIQKGLIEIVFNQDKEDLRFMVLKKK